MERVMQLLSKSWRPLIIAGGGIRLSGGVEEFRKLVEKAKIPVVAPLMGIDLLQWDNPYYMGHGGTKGQRSGNMALNKADLIISIGSRLCISFIGHQPELFAPTAKKIVVDIDRKEHSKKTIKIDLFVNMDAKEFIKELTKIDFYPDPKWMKECSEIKRKYFDFLGTKMYKSIYKIAKLSRPYDVFTTDSGVTAFGTIQTVRIKEGQRLIAPGTLTMGYGLPAAIGIWAAHPKGDIIAIIGDGSLQMNIHELQTIVHNKIPAKIFIINNDGYLAIRTTEKNQFGRFIGESSESGISFPDTRKIAKAYGIKYIKEDIKAAMDFKGTVICEIFTPKWQKHLTVKFQRPLDEMSP